MASGDSLPFPSLSPRCKRQRSPSQSPTFVTDNTESSRRQRRRHDLSVQVCQDFIRSTCRRAEFACKFAHPLSTVIIDRGKVIACADAMHNKCKRHRTCRYFHPPRHIRQSLFKAFSMEDAKDQVSQRSSTLRPNEGSEDTEAVLIQRQRHDLSVEVCKDFIRSTCRRAEIDCKFAHPPSAVAIERGKVIACFDALRSKCVLGRNCSYFHPPPHIQGPLLKAIGMEDTEDLMNHSYDIDDTKASSRQSQQHNLSVDVCKDFIRRSCGRAEIDCKFAHPPSSVIIERGKVIACFDSLSGKCFHVRTCPYFHPPPQIQEALLKEIGMEGAKDQMALQDLESSVKLPSYPQPELPSYPQPENDHESVPVCRDFLKNACNRHSCKYAHPDSLAMALQDFESSVKLESYPQPENDHESVPVCRDFLKNACNRHSCKYAHPDSLAMGHLQHHGLSLKLPSSTPLKNGAIQTATRLYHDVVPVCKDFLKNSCNRDYCRYFHLVPQSEVYLQQHGTLVKLPCSPPRETEQKRLGVCRDFLKNACHRDSCKFAHPNPQKKARPKVVDNQVEICRDFSRGLCHRANCHFYHPGT